MATFALSFSGPISHPASTKLRNVISSIVNGGKGNPPQGLPCERLILLMNSGGGNIDDGFSLYNLLVGLPFPVTTVNTGVISSIANIVFLGGENRIACPHSYFHFHKVDFSFPAPHTMTADHLEEHMLLHASAKISYQEIFKARTTFTDADFEALKFLHEPLVKDTAFAQQKGIVQQVATVKLAADTILFNVDY